MYAATIAGVGARLVRVEVHRGRGLPRLTIVGLAGGAVRESVERIQAACAAIDLPLRPRRTTVNLAPADVRKQGAGLDLPIALGLLAADGRFPADALADTLCMGELSLDARVRAVAGVLPALLQARRAGLRRALVPAANGAEAAAVRDIEAAVVEHLEQAVAWARGEATLPAAEPAQRAQEPAPPAVDLAQVRGHALARRALEIAAAGGHHLLLRGPPGAGKTLLARALPGLLPPLAFEEALEVSAVYSVVGGLDGHGLLRRRPFRAPHHGVTAAGLIGGGSPLRPGEVSLACHGVLFLDELPEFRRHVLETLRQPLEEGFLTISRANESHTFPATFQLVAAMNECPCGRGPADGACLCSELEIERYGRRVSGPLLDRIDLFVAVDRVPLQQLVQEATNAESSARVAARVAAARERQEQRLLQYGVATVGHRRTNAALPSALLARACRLPAPVVGAARRIAESLDLSARAWHRMLRVARTIADLEASDAVAEEHVVEALGYRRRDLADRPSA